MYGDRPRLDFITVAGLLLPCRPPILLFASDRAAVTCVDVLVIVRNTFQHVTDELQAMTAFDSQITYNKGQSILRMFDVVASSPRQRCLAVLPFDEPR
jgi:hypothetical protein